ncbi:uncharacterized protein LOC107038577 [Diachasma alloeum]|uniref:uncharacterized protein LOC107038577 n=1 Tax=Diachasma alloeum TaxID=454923 RepID=UPI0007383008|nr:uncharacterized protein LOC107038577 [Diachasma alloeum]
MDSAYLEAIQGIPGSTPGEKYKALNAAAAAVISSKSKNPDVNPLREIKSLGIPEPLIPLVHAEVSKNLRDPVGIIEALKSEDEIVFDRALKAKWFFDGSNPQITNAQYYEDHIFPDVSLDHREALVKKLSASLSSQNADKSIAEGFYAELAAKYGGKLAESLLIACSEEFIKKLIIEERKIGLNTRLMKIIYRSYPNVIIDYLKLSNRDDPRERNFAVVNISDYTDFLPILLKRNINSFIEVIEMHERSLGIKLSRKRTELFMKQGIDAVVRSPRAFLPMMPLKVTGKLSKGQFKSMFRNIFPEKREQFKFEEIFGYLEYYQEEKLELLLSTFEEVYGVKLLDCEGQVTPEVLRALPAEERVRQARKKLERDQDWHLGGSWEFKMSWRCYLSTEESIPMIKEQIRKSSDVNDRRDLLELMIFTCAVNGDEVALLEVLKYINVRHKNEQGWLLLEVLGGLLEYFQAQNLSAEHWEVLDDLIRLLDVKNELQSRSGQAQQVITAGIHFNLINKLPIDRKINLLIELYSKTWGGKWNILTDYPDYERKCLESFLEIIEQRYPENHEIWKESWPAAVIDLVQAIYNFNERNSKNPTSKLENFSLKGFLWLLEAVKKILNDKDEEKWTKSRLSEILKKGEKDLWEALVPGKPEGPVINFQTTEVLCLLKKNPKEILENWEKYLEGLRENIYGRLAQRFVKSCRWHQELPIKFSQKAVSNLTTNKDAWSLVVLALLYDGSAFERVITPFVPKTPGLNPNDDNAKTNFVLTFTIPKSLNLVIPPVSPDLVLEFCVGDYIHTAVNCLTNIGRRVSADKVIPFAIKLMDRGVSIKKHGIRLFTRVARNDAIRVLLTNLLRNEKHRSIRAIVFDKIMQMFREEPSRETWPIMREAIQDLRPDDDAIMAMTNISRIPDEFVVDYVRMLLAAIRRLEGVENGLDRKQALARFSQLINSAISVAYVFPEELHEFILKEYFADLSQPDYAFSPAMRYYVVRGYLMRAEEKLEHRLQHLTGLLTEIIKKYWDVEGEKAGLLLGNHVVYKFTQEVIEQQFSSPITKAIVQALFKSFFSILKPPHAPTSYLYLTYAASFEVAIAPKDLAGKIAQLLPTIIAALSRESLALVAKVLHEFLDARISRDEWGHSELEFVESLLEFQNEDSTILASMMLNCSFKITDEPRFWRIVRGLRKHQHPAVVANVYVCVNQLEGK